MWVLVLICALWHVPGFADNVTLDRPQSGKESLIKKAKLLDGLIPLYYQADSGRLYADVRNASEPIIYYGSLARGIGSNDLGFDRGRLGGTHLVKFQRIGSRVLLKALNTRYVARSSDEAERRAVEEAFADSIIWGFQIVEETDRHLLIDLTDFVSRDSIGLRSFLKKRGEGDYKIDPSRSAVFEPRTAGFPNNTEIEVILTYVGDPAGTIIPTVTPDPTAITIHAHHSFVRLPDDNYDPLVYDARSGFIDSGEYSLVYDYASSISSPIKSAFARRHRLKKLDVTSPTSRPIEPIVYWVDPGVPEPIRSALIEGASWWNEAFEVAGYEDAFQVKLLPESADPMDVRYNVIQWVHRSTRGWSYGSSIRDPRTQEIIKGHVTLGSLRVRQDYLIAEALLSPHEESGEPDDVLVAFALSRIRQLAAHEVGHTLGLAHNFASSANGRASVMDYPHPLIKLSEDGKIDIRDAYDEGIGEWDKRAILWGYQDFSNSENSEEGRAKIISETIASGLTFVADEHARVSQRQAAGPAHPMGSLWDNGVDSVAELSRVMKLRELVLERFSEQAIRPGVAMAKLEDALVPAFLMHRYQIEAAATVIGGQWFTYAMRGDGQIPVRSVASKTQLRAIDVLLDTLDPEVLEIPSRILNLIPPRPPQSGVSRELFPRQTGYVFDPLAAAATAANLTLRELLDSKRAARLNNQKLLDQDLPGFGELLAKTKERLWSQQSTFSHKIIAERVQMLFVEKLMQIAAFKHAAPQVRADALQMLVLIMDQLKKAGEVSSTTEAHNIFLTRHIEAYLNSPEIYDVATLITPPGSPI